MNLNFSPFKTIQSIVIYVDIGELNILEPSRVDIELRRAEAAHETQLRVIIYVVIVSLRLGNILRTFSFRIKLCL